MKKSEETEPEKSTVRQSTARQRIRRASGAARRPDIENEATGARASGKWPWVMAKVASSADAEAGSLAKEGTEASGNRTVARQRKPLPGRRFGRLGNGRGGGTGENHAEAARGKERKG